MTQELQLRIAREYQSLQCDSALVWYNNLRNADEPVRTQAFIGLVQLLSASGRYANATALLNHPEAPTITSPEGYKTIWLLYREAVPMAQLPEFKQELQKLEQQYYDSMLVAYQRDNAEESQLWLQLYHATDSHDWPLALQASRQLLARTNPSEHLYAILAYGQAMLYELAGDQEHRSEWLVRSAITDVRCGITDNGSSWIVAQDCYDNGNIKLAYHFINYSLQNATAFNAPTRFIQIFTIGHIITSRYEEELNRSSIRLLSVLVLLAVALLVALFLFVYTRRQNSKLSAINSQLSTANHVKEQYICRYLEVYSDYIRRLTTMARKAGEKDSSAFMDREMENFYRSFDDTFLSLYGNFVEEFNALLRPEARITPKPGERMTIEMRIFALILLGITSSAKIAELLCYSPNTISNYRVKVKNSALGERDSFEHRIQQIGK